MSRTRVDSAFPIIEENIDEGMTLRDYFAAKAMQGFTSCQDFMNEHVTRQAGSKAEACENVARWAYMLADAMLEERNKT